MKMDSKVDEKKELTALAVGFWLLADRQTALRLAIRR
jgi:hypothetical protein